MKTNDCVLLGSIDPNTGAVQSATSVSASENALPLRVHIWGDRNTNGTELFRELADGETWMPHPSGNGIVVCHPDRQSLWCRMEPDCYCQSYIDLDEIRQLTPLEHETRRIDPISEALFEVGRITLSCPNPCAMTGVSRRTT